MNPDCASKEIGTVGRPLEPFRQPLFMHGLNLTRGKTTTLQVNVA